MQALKASSNSPNRTFARSPEIVLVIGLAATTGNWPSPAEGREMVKESEPIGSFEGAQTRIESIGKVEAAGEFMGTIVSRAI
jgi:hypothetical protein